MKLFVFFFLSFFLYTVTSSRIKARNKGQLTKILATRGLFSTPGTCHVRNINTRPKS